MLHTPTALQNFCSPAPGGPTHICSLLLQGCSSRINRPKMAPCHPPTEACSCSDSGLGALSIWSPPSRQVVASKQAVERQVVVKYGPRQRLEE